MECQHRVVEPGPSRRQHHWSPGEGGGLKHIFFFNTTVPGRYFLFSSDGMASAGSHTFALPLLTVPGIYFLFSGDGMASAASNTFALPLLMSWLVWSAAKLSTVVSWYH